MTSIAFELVASSPETRSSGFVSGSSEGRTECCEDFSYLIEETAPQPKKPAGTDAKDSNVLSALSKAQIDQTPEAAILALFSEFSKKDGQIEPLFFAEGDLPAGEIVPTINQDLAAIAQIEQILEERASQAGVKGALSLIPALTQSVLVQPEGQGLPSQIHSLRPPPFASSLNPLLNGASKLAALAPVPEQSGTEGTRPSPVPQNLLAREYLLANGHLRAVPTHQLPTSHVPPEIQENAPFLPPHGGPQGSKPNPANLENPQLIIKKGDQEASQTNDPTIERTGSRRPQVAGPHLASYKSLIHSMFAHGQAAKQDAQGQPVEAFTTSQIEAPSEAAIRGQSSPQRLAPQLPPVPLNTLAVTIARQALSGHTRFDIRLDPPELGRIEVKLNVNREGLVNTHLVVERVETLDLLQRDARALERALASAGFDKGENGLSFSLKDQSLAGQKSHESDDHKDLDPDDEQSDNFESDNARDVIRSQTHYIAEIGLDIRI